MKPYQLLMLFVPTSWRKRALSRSKSAAVAAWWLARRWWARAGKCHASGARSRELDAPSSAAGVSIRSDRMCMKFKWQSSCVDRQPFRSQREEPVLLLSVKSAPRPFMQDRRPSVHIGRVNARQPRFQPAEPSPRTGPRSLGGRRFGIRVSESIQAIWRCLSLWLAARSLRGAGMAA